MSFINVINEYRLYIRAVHIIFVVFFMAGILYLPRLYVYHSENRHHNDICKLLMTMERRLNYIILIPAITITIITGIILTSIYGIDPLWIKLKLSFAIAMFIYYISMIFYHKFYISNGRHFTSKSLRFINEIPGIIFIAIAFVATIRYH